MGEIPERDQSMEWMKVWKNGGEIAVQEENGNRMTRDGKGMP
jgi:hypothetical protein